MKKLKFVWIVYILMFVISVSSAMAIDESSHPYDFNILYGDYVTGDVNSTHVMDDNYLTIQENNTEPSLTVDFFINDGLPNRLRINARYRGGQTHFVLIEIYDYNTSTFVNKGFLPNSNDFLFHDIIIDENNIQFDEIIVRFEHNGGSNPAHFLDIDYIGVEFVEEEQTRNILNVDLSDTFTIILLCVLLITGLLGYIFKYALLGGGLVLLIGLILVFSGFLLILSVFIIFIGVLVILSEDN